MDDDLHLLYVEDDPRDQELTVRMLKKRIPQIDITVTETISNAQKFLKQQPFDVALIDYKLQDGDGISLVSWILDKNLSCAPIIVTAYGGEETALTTIRAGAEDYITKKPGYLKLLPLLIENVLTKFKTRKTFRKQTFRALFCGIAEKERSIITERLRKEVPSLRIEFSEVGKASLELLEHERFNVCVVESMSPDISYLEFIKNIRFRNLTVPMILLAGFGNENTVLQSYKVGVDDYIVKEGDYPYRLACSIDKVIAKSQLKKNECLLSGTEKNLHKVNRMLKVLCKGSQIVVRATDEVELMKGICKAIVQNGNYHMAWIGFAERSKEKRVRPMAHWGIEENYLNVTAVTWDDSEMGRGPTGKAIRTTKPSVIQNIKDDPNYRPWRVESLKRGYASCLALPIIISENNIWALTIYSKEPDGFDRKEIKFLLELAEDLAHGIRSLRTNLKRKQADEAVQQKVRELAAINTLVQEVTASLSMDQVLSATNKHVLSSLDPDLVIIYLSEGDELILAGEKTRNCSSVHKGKGMLRHGKCLCGVAAEKGEPVYSIDIHTDPRCTMNECKDAGIRSLIAMPLFMGNQILGVLGIGYTKEYDLSPKKDFLETFSGQIGIGLQNAMLYKMVQQQVKQLEENVIDIKKTESQLRRAKILLQSVFDGISDPLVMIDKDMKIGMLNRSAAKYYKTEYKNVLGKRCYQILRGISEPCETCPVPEAVSRREKITYERRGFMDSNRFEEISVFPLPQGHKSMEGVVLRIEDITEKKQIQEQLVLADRLSSLGQLSGGIAHEIRNPLASIRLFVDILTDEENITPNYRTKEILDDIEQNVNKIDEIIRRVLNFAKPAGKISTEINMNSLIRQEIKLWSDRIRKSGIDLKLFLQDNIPPILADSIEIRQVMNNLILNSIEEMERGGTLSLITTHAKSSFHRNRPVVRIEVKDTGTGIRPECKRNIFNPFFTTKQGGTGLGLAISHQIIKRHGGIISFESKPKQGTTFIIEVPCKDAE